MSAWDFSALHAELGLICPRDNSDVLWCACCGDECGCSWVHWGLGLSVEFEFGLGVLLGACI